MLQNRLKRKKDNYFMYTPGCILEKGNSFVVLFQEPIFQMSDLDLRVPEKMRLSDQQLNSTCTAQNELADKPSPQETSFTNAETVNSGDSVETVKSLGRRSQGQAPTTTTVTGRVKNETSEYSVTSYAGGDGSTDRAGVVSIEPLIGGVRRRSSSGETGANVDVPLLTKTG